MGDRPKTRLNLLRGLADDDTKLREFAWEEFHGIYAPIISGFARKLGVRGTNVDDVIQDVMLGLFSNSRRFHYDPARGRFRGYLKVCTFRAMQRRFRGRTRLNQVPIDQIDPEALEIEHIWKDVWEQQRLRRAFDLTRELYENNKTFQAFDLFVIRGQDAQDVAKSLGMSADSVYKAKLRVSAALRRQVASLEAAEG